MKLHKVGLSLYNYKIFYRGNLCSSISLDSAKQQTISRWLLTKYVVVQTQVSAREISGFTVGKGPHGVVNWGLRVGKGPNGLVTWGLRLGKVPHILVTWGLRLDKGPHGLVTWGLRLGKGPHVLVTWGLRLRKGPHVLVTWGLRLGKGPHGLVTCCRSFCLTPPVQTYRFSSHSYNNHL
jgi:hypothetical protein